MDNERNVINIYRAKSHFLYLQVTCSFIKSHDNIANVSKAEGVCLHLFPQESHELYVGQRT